ncbi:putative tetrahydroberberine oxidase [Helianthus debilis subsp. tardiflorus]
MKISHLVFLFVLTLCFFVSWGATFPFDVDDSEDLISCLKYKTNNVTFISQLVFTPLNSSFQSIWEARVNNLRFIKPTTPKPSVIVTPIDETQIQTTLFCTKRHGYQIRIRSGGHDFEAISSSAVVPFVMLDLVNMKSIDVDVGNKTAWVQPGARLGELYYSISQKTNTLYFPAGVCPTVGVGGYMGGGGYGNLVRKYGTAADNVLDVRFMDVNGNILVRKSMGEDLFWALRGGGTSSFGIVLAWKLRLVPVPEIVTVFGVNVTLEENATDVFYKYQYVAPRLDPDLLIRVRIFGEFIGNTTNKTIRLLFQGLYLGKTDKMLRILDKSFPELKVRRENCEEMSMVQSSIVLADQGWSSSTPTEAIANQSAIVSLFWNYKIKLDYVRTPIPKSGLRKIWRKIFENDQSVMLVVYTFGGKMEEYSDTAIPYPHRAGVLFQLLKGVNFADQTSDTTPTSLKRIQWLQSLDKLLEPYVSKNPREAYINYIDLDLGVGRDTYEEASVWGERYWKRENFKKLIRIKAKVDPENFFRHPQSIPVFDYPLVSSS